MVKHFTNRLLVMSLAIAFAGLLTCAACFLNAVLPQGSVAAFLGWLFAVAVTIVGVMGSFAWSCEKLDDRARSLYRSLPYEEKRDLPQAVTGARGGRRAVLVERTTAARPYPVSHRLQNYPILFRDAFPPVDARKVGGQ